MAIRYKALTELYQETQRKVTAPAEWQQFLTSACRNYRLSFDEQLLVYAQRPDATAVLEIERWNKRFGRWVNRGANGIAVFDGEHISAIQNVRDGIDLMGPQGDFRIHSLKVNMPSVILTGTDAVEGFIVDAAQPFSAVNVPPYPFRKFLLDEFLPVLGNSSFLLVEDSFFIAVFILNKSNHLHNHFVVSCWLPCVPATSRCPSSSRTSRS